MTFNAKSAIQFIGDFLFPRHCLGCGQTFKGEEEALCLNCIFNLPLTYSWNTHENIMYRKMYGRFPFQNAVSFLYFTKSGLTQHLIHEFKYKSRKDVAFLLGHLFGNFLSHLPWYQNIDLIIPVPIHERKKRTRGFNQAEIIAEGLSHITKTPLDTACLLKCKHTATQTKKSIAERIENVKDVFTLSEPKILEGKHILLLDDVLTTGSTLESCAGTLLQVPNIQISIATIAMAWE